MKSKKDQFSKMFAFILLLLAFIASVFIGVKGAVIKVQAYIESKKPKPIILHEFYEDGKLWFYSPGTTSIQGTYQCNGKNIYCGYAFELLDDSSYALQSYNNNSRMLYTSYIMGYYAFIIDAENPLEDGDYYYRNESVKLLNITGGNIEKEYSAIKSYGNLNGIGDSYFIARNQDGKWGVIQITATGEEDKIPFEYDFIGIFVYNTRQSPVVADKFVVKKGSEWSVIDLTGASIISNIPEPIYGFDGETVITRDSGNSYNIYNKNGTLLNTTVKYKSIQITGSGYTLAKTDNVRYGIYDNTGTEIMSEQLFFKEEITAAVIGDETVFKLNGSEVYKGKNLSNNGQPLSPQ